MYFIYAIQSLKDGDFYTGFTKDQFLNMKEICNGA